MIATVIETGAIETIRKARPHAFTVTTGRADGINGYGQSYYVTVSLEIADEVCLTCGRWLSDIDTADEIAGTHRHKWQRRMRLVATGGGRTTDEATQSAEIVAADFLRRNPGFLR